MGESDGGNRRYTMRTWSNCRAREMEPLLSRKPDRECRVAFNINDRANDGNSSGRQRMVYTIFMKILVVVGGAFGVAGILLVRHRLMRDDGSGLSAAQAAGGKTAAVLTANPSVQPKESTLTRREGSSHTSGVWSSQTPAGTKNGDTRDTNIFDEDGGEGKFHGSPNVIFILIDDVGMNDLGKYSTDIMQLTPYLDSLAHAGVTLTNYYTNHICTPSRVSASKAFGRFVRHGSFCSFTLSCIA